VEAAAAVEVAAAAAVVGDDAFDVLAPLSPLAKLERRDATLDGSVPLRVARACVPLLEGNAFGFQICFQWPLLARTRLGRATLVRTPELERVDALQRASARYLIEQGVVRGAWAAFLRKHWFTSDRGRLRIWTGLCVRAGNDAWLRVSGTKNRGPHGLGADEAYVIDHEDFVPLVVDFVLPSGESRLVGEVATLAVVRPGVHIEVVPIRQAKHLAHAHAAFYDAKYFGKKRDENETTRKYRRTIAKGARDDARPATGDVTLRVAHIAGPAPVIEREIRVLSPSSASAEKKKPPRPFDRVRFDNAVGFEARWDGYSLVVDPNRRELDAGAREVEAALDGVLPGEHAGALLYLTKYFTPHPRGEPHFFVKPWAFVETPPGWSSVLEGTRGHGWDVMRGVVRTDAFHAVPAVFDVHRTGAFEISRGAPLLDVFAIPRDASAIDPVITTEVA
jgi:hypothetical protein